MPRRSAAYTWAKLSPISSCFEFTLKTDRVGGGDAQIGTGEKGPFFRCARVGLKEMSESQARAECRAIAPVETKKRFG